MTLEVRKLGFSQQIQDRMRLSFYTCLVVAGVVIPYFFMLPGIRGIQIGWVLGLFVHWEMTSTCSMALPERWMPGEARAILESCRYRAFKNSRDHYRLQLPRWMFFNQQDVIFNHGKVCATVTGPKNVLVMISKKLQANGPRPVI